MALPRSIKPPPHLATRHVERLLVTRRRRRPKQVSRKDLRKLVQQGKALRVGATNNPRRRYNEYKRRGKPYRGSQMLFAKPSDMMRDEDKLLSLRKPPLNVQQFSNAARKRGFVYAWRKNDALAKLAEKRHYRHRVFVFQTGDAEDRKKVSQKVLRKLVQQSKVLIVWATSNTTRPDNEYNRRGKPYRDSQMLFAKTWNMVSACP